MTVPLIVLLQQRVGARRGGRVLAYVIAWDTARRSLGAEWPGDNGISAEIVAYSEWWHQPVRTSWDELERFREAFPTLTSPSELIVQLGPAFNRRRGAAGLGRLAVPA